MLNSSAAVMVSPSQRFPPLSLIALHWVVGDGGGVGRTTVISVPNGGTDRCCNGLSGSLKTMLAQNNYNL